MILSCRVERGTGTGDADGRALSECRFRLSSDAEPGHIWRETLAPGSGVDAVGLRAVSIGAIAAIRVCFHQATDAGRRIRIEREAKMPVERPDRFERIADQITVADVEDRLGEGLLVSGADHQSGAL